MSATDLWEALVARGARLYQDRNGDLVIETPAPMPDLEDDIHRHSVDLLARVRRGGMTRQQLDALWTTLRPQLLREMLGQRIGADDAQEALGDAYLALVDALPQYRHHGEASAAAWARGITSARLRDRQRRRSTQARLECHQEPTAPDRLAAALDEETIARFVERLDAVGLSRPERVAFVGVLHGIDRGTLASMLGVTAGCLGSHLHNARKRVQSTIPDAIPGRAA